MKKIIFLSGILYALTSFPANAQIIFQYPHGRDWDRQQSQRQYWEQVRRYRNAEDHEREKSHDNGNHHAYGKDPEHHKENWKDGSKHDGEYYEKNRSYESNKYYGKDGRHHNNNR